MFHIWNCFSLLLILIGQVDVKQVQNDRMRNEQRVISGSWLVNWCRELHTITTLEILNMCISFTECYLQPTWTWTWFFYQFQSCFTGCLRKKPEVLARHFKFFICLICKFVKVLSQSLQTALTAVVALSKRIDNAVIFLKLKSGISETTSWNFFLEYPRISPGYKILSRVTETIPSNISSSIRPYSHKKCNIYNVMESISTWSDWAMSEDWVVKN